jgi:hypothetical protein
VRIEGLRCCLCRLSDSDSFEGGVELGLGRLSELLASPESPRPGSSCAFSSQLLSQGSNVRELEMPPDSGVVAGYQLTALEPIAVPAG